ncbi:MAG: hypothetical protein K1000chlam3_01354 [Chlamydiae bacterium]|nr:hypothetical protein [Chlamydiota bacterium]
MNDSEGNPLSFAFALLCIIQKLMVLSSRDLEQALGEIAHVLYYKKIDEANQILIEKYLSSPSFNDLLPPLKSSDGTINYLFTSSAIRLFSNLLVFKFDHRRGNLKFQMMLVRNGLHIPHSDKDVRSSIIPLFLLANQLIVHIENDLAFDDQTHLDAPQIYYSRIQEDPLAMIGRGMLLYDTVYFNEKLQDLLGMNMSELSESLFLLFVHIQAHQPAIIDPEITFRRIIQDDQKLRIKKILDLLSVEARSINALYSEIASTFNIRYIQDQTCRGKPFLKSKDRYICIRPDQMTSAFCDFPYHYVLNVLSKEDKEKFFKESGDAFDQYIATISQRVLGNKSIKYYYKKKPYRDNQSSDLHLEIDENMRVIIEIKGAKENDDVRIGDKQALCDKFIHLGGTEIKPKGVLQVIKDAKKFRGDLPFSREIFTVIIFLGRFPETGDFDEMVKREIEGSLEYKEYLENEKNYPTIWLSASTAELLFSAMAQGVNVKELFKNIIYVVPSQIRGRIVEHLSLLKKNVSLSPLFENELRQLSEKCREMLEE